MGKKQLKKEIIFVLLFTLFAFFFFYLGEKVFDLSNLSILKMFVFWFVAFAISFKTINYFTNRWLK